MNGIYRMCFKVALKSCNVKKEVEKEEREVEKITEHWEERFHPAITSSSNAPHPRHNPKMILMERCKFPTV